MSVTSLSITARVTLGARRVDVELDSGPGALVLLGPNGAGKSTLLKLALGVITPERGRISVGDDVLFDSLQGVDVPLEQRRLGYVPQHYALFPHLDVAGNVEFALASAAPGLSRVERARRVSAQLDELGLLGLAKRQPGSLSGGEQQRLALARALVVGPRALLLDEPLAALDVYARREVRAFLGEWLRRVSLPAIVVTHDAADARALGARVAVLEDGRVTQQGAWTELCERPASAFVEALTSSAR